MQRRTDSSGDVVPVISGTHRGHRTLNEKKIESLNMGRMLVGGQPLKDYSLPLFETAFGEREEILISLRGNEAPICIRTRQMPDRKQYDKERKSLLCQINAWFALQSHNSIKGSYDVINAID